MTPSSPDSPPLRAASTPTRSRREGLVLAGLCALAIAGLAALAAATGWAETRAQLLKLGLPQIAALLALSGVNYLLRGLRWHLFARTLGLATTPLQNLRHFVGGFALSVTPGRIGELVRMRWLWRETGWAVERTAPLVLMDRAGDLAAMALILAVAISVAATGIAYALPVSLVALGAAVVATRPGLLSRMTLVAYRLTGLAPRRMAGLRAAARTLGVFSAPGVAAGALLLGIAGWVAEGYAFQLLLAWMGAEIGLAKALAIFTFATLAGGLTGAPGGLGGAEAAMIALLTLDGIPLEVSIPATAIIRVTTLWFAIGLGLLVFPLAERMSFRAMS